MRSQGEGTGAAQRSGRVAAVAAAALAALAALAAGCGPDRCDRSPEGNPPEPYVEGTVEGCTYMSSPWDGRNAETGELEGLLYFPGGMRYAIEHKLGVVPRSIQVYLSFDESGTEAGTLAQAAGNQAEVTCVDRERVILFNGSCSSYWLLVTASAAVDGTCAPAPRAEGEALPCDALPAE